jgi:hypothetical protein
MLRGLRFKLFELMNEGMLIGIAYSIETKTIQSIQHVQDGNPALKIFPEIPCIQKGP